VRRKTWIMLSKGIEAHSLLLPVDIVKESLQGVGDMVVVSGPNFSKQLINKEATATVVASTNEQAALSIAGHLSNAYCKPYLSNDVNGVQAAGAIKNVIAFVVGIIQGLGCQSNTQSFILTRGLAEIAAIANHFGGRTATVYGLSGVGDLVLTALGGQSRNVTVGRMFGKGATLDEVKENVTVLPEAINTIQSVVQLMQRAGLTLPICQAAYDVVYNGKSAQKVLSELMGGSIEYE